MGSALEIAVKMRKMLIISIRACHRSVCNHPILVGLLGFLIFLYRSFPFVFSILVSASPVLVCTAVLLGTLLSFGQPNIPEVEKEEEVTHGISSFQTGLSEAATVIAEKDESLIVKTQTENRSVIEERSIEEASLAGDKVRNGEEGDSLISFEPLADEISQNEKQVSEPLDREFCSFEMEKKREVHEEKLKAEGVSSEDEAIEKQYVFVQKVYDDILDNETGETAVEPLQTFEGDHLDFSPNSSWKPVEINEEEDSLESGSDQAESSSPDASMADIMPMLEELHPLLDMEASQPAQLSHDDSAASERSQKGDDGSVESDEDTENRVEVEEDGVDDHDDEEEEGGKEDESKSAIKWTEDDQKNLMDLGTLELERNQRLENLIARRRARKMMVEKNLIDFESTDLSFNIAPITTTRRNPFDLLDDSYVAMGLPPIPGSAPSILQPRRNPFDIPYDPNEEKPDLKGDSFEQEFMIFNQKDTFFRRHESFSFRPSVVGTTKLGRQDMSWKPFFVSEQMASDGTSYASFQRQLSEISETNLSSVQDTESVCSTDQDERKLNEQDLSQETELISNIDHASQCVEHGSQSSGEIDSVERIQVDESNAHHDEVEIVLGGVENLSEMELYSEAGEVAIHEEFNTGGSENHLGRETVDEESNSRSSRSSLSEVIDNIPDEKREISASLQAGDNHLLVSRISTQDSAEEVDFRNVSAGVEDNQHGEPRYDSSPLTAGKVALFSSVSSDSATKFSERVLPPAPAEMIANVTDEDGHTQEEPRCDSSPLTAGKVASFSSVSSDSATEFSERVLPPAPAEMIANVTDKGGHTQEAYLSGHEENHTATSQLHMEVNNEWSSGDSKDIDQHDVNATELASVAPSFVEHNESSVPESEVMQPVSVDLCLSSDDGSIWAETNTAFVHEQEPADHLHAESKVLKDHSGDLSSGYHLASEKSHSPDNESVKEGSVHYGVDSYRFDDGNMFEVVQDVDEKLDLVDSYSQHKPSSDLSISVPQDLQPSLVVEQAPAVHPNMPSEETDHLEKTLLNKEDMSEVERDKDEKLDLMVSYSQHLPSSDSSVSVPQDLQLSLVAEQAPLVHPNLPCEETKHVEETLLNKEDMLQVEEDKVLVSNSFEQDNIDLHEDSDEKVVSSSSDCQCMQYEVKSPCVLDNDLSSPDKSVVAPSFSEHDESQKSYTVQVESTLAKDQVPPQISSVTPDSSVTAEFKSSTGQVDPEVDRHGKVAGEMLEFLDSSAEGNRSQVTDENIKVSDELKEIDEGFLSELDTVGDFSIGDAGVSLHPDLLPEETTIKDVQVSSLPKDTAEFGQEIPFLEARSLEDIDLAFKQLKEGVDVNEVILPSMITDQLSSDKSEEHFEADSDLQVLEARSADDTGINLEKISEGNHGGLPEVLDLKDGSADVEAKEDGSGKLIESCDVKSGTEQPSKTSVIETENVPTSNSGNEKTHHRRSSSSSSSSSSSGDSD